MGLKVYRWTVKKFLDDRKPTKNITLEHKILSGFLNQLVPMTKGPLALDIRCPTSVTSIQSKFAVICTSPLPLY